MSSAGHDFSGNRSLICIIQRDGVMPYPVRHITPGEKYIVFFVCKGFSPLFAKLAVCLVVFLTFTA